jgi:demethylmenaquinone methyltransferase/2-methoxy-6-polyprenyl-1,4-benzoquinol methylase
MTTNENIENKDKNPPREDVYKMFDRISGRYDLLNRLLSFRRDIGWRKKLSELLPKKDNLKILDLATGTGDVLFSLIQNNKHIVSGVGLDMASEMLKLAQVKINKNNLQDKLSLIRGDATKIPFDRNSFDAITIAFGIRNVVDVNQSLSEMHRVLNPQGKALILEFSLPKSRIIKASYLFYFRKILPMVGGIISGDSDAYRYLNQTVESFTYGVDFCELMEKAGFKSVKQHPMTFGIATVYEGTKN